MFYEILSKINQVIQTLILTCMPNIRILAKAVVKISFWQGFSIAIMGESKKGITQSINHGTRSNVNQVVKRLIPVCQISKS